MDRKSALAISSTDDLEAENDRLAALARYEILDTPHEKAFDLLTQTASRVFKAPIALVSLVGDTRQWFKSACGLSAKETPREWAFCDHAIRSNDIFEVCDASKDPRFATNPLVVGPPHIRFYAGAPLQTPDGFRLGTLCIIDTAVRPKLTAAERVTLRDFSALAMDQIETRLAARRALVETERRRRSQASADAALQAIVQAYRSKSEFLASLSHELRTPLNAIIGFSEMIKLQIAGPVGSERYLEYAKLIGESGSHLVTLVTDVLEFSRAEAGRIELRLEPFAVAEAVEEAVGMLLPLARDRGTAVDIQPIDPSLQIVADRLRFKQVIINLVSNAIKFTPGGRVVVAAERCGEVMTLLVTDTGVGICEADLERVLKPFDQGTADSDAKRAGFGLGLPIAKALVERHGGVLGIESAAGRGTTVRVQMPVMGPEHRRPRP